MRKQITVLMGDGIGPEVTKQAIKALDTVADVFGHEFNYDYGMIGAESIEKTGVPLSADTIEKCRNSDAVLLGAVGHPSYDNNPGAKIRPEQGLLELRTALQLYANVRPIVSYPALYRLSPLRPERLKNVDLVIYRELVSGIYFGKKKSDEAWTFASDECAYNREEIERIAHLAFQHARKRKRHVTLIDKANVLETSRLWRKVVQDLSAKYPDVYVDYMFVDNAAMQLILNAQQFDVILTENMFGDILSDEASVLGGSLGMLPSASIGPETAMFEPIHGAYHQAAGKNIANPIGAILAAALMLEHFEMKNEAQIIRNGVNWCLRHGFVTIDIDKLNCYSTSVIGDIMSEYIEKEEIAAMEGSTII